MATNFFKVKKGQNLKPQSSSTVSVQGDLDVTSSDGKLNYHNGTTASPAVTEAHTAILSNKSFSDNVGIKTSSPGAALEVTEITGSQATIFSTGYGSNGAFITRRANGTLGSPTAVTTNDLISNFGGRGYGATAFTGTSRGAIRISAAEPWTDAAQGAYITFRTTAIGGTTTSEVARITDSGLFGILKTPTTALDVNGTATATAFAGPLTGNVTGTASGNTTYTANNHGVVISGSGNAMTVIAPDASTTKVLVSGGLSANPSWQTLTSELPAFTGDVTTSSGSSVTTVAKIQGTTVSGTTGSGNVVFSASPTLSGTVTVTSGPILSSSGIQIPVTTGVFTTSSTSNTYISGDTGISNGAGIKLYGTSHASKPSWIEFTQDGAAGLTFNSTGLGLGIQPTVPFHLSNSVGPMMTINSSNTDGGYLTWQTSGTAIGFLGSAKQALGASYSSADFGIGGNATNKFQIGNLNVGAVVTVLTGGNVGIMNATPAKTLDITGTFAVSGVATFTAAPVLSSTTASQALFTDGSKNVVSNAITGSGNVVMSTSPTLVTPALGTPSALVGTNITGTAAGLTAGNVTTNANLTGPITSSGNATSIASKTGTGTTFVMSAGPTFSGTTSFPGSTSIDGSGNAVIGGTLSVSGNSTLSGLVGIGATPVAGTQVLVTTPTSLTGTWSNSGSSGAITGVGTKALTELRVGATLTLNGETQQVTTVTSDTSVTTAAFTGANSGVTGTRNALPQVYFWPNGNVQLGGSRTSVTSANIQLKVLATATGASDASAPATTVNVDQYSGAAATSNSIIMRCAKGTEASPSAQQSGNGLGSIIWQGHDGTAFGSSARILSNTTQIQAVGSHGGSLLFQTVPNSSTTLTTALTIDQDQSATFAGKITPSAGIVGTATNNNATAGNVGEYVESLVTSYTNIPGATTAWGDLTSISLTAGDWDVTGFVDWSLNGSVQTVAQIGISTTSGNSATGLVDGNNMATLVIATAAQNRAGVIPAYRMSLSGTTTVYFKLNATYTVATPQYVCRLSARRMR